MPPVLIDRTQLDQVLFNLSTNACDAMPLGGCLTFVVSHLPGKERTAGYQESSSTCSAPTRDCLALGAGR